jgi:hypothetical protein
MISALMLAAAPFRWADPATWPWVVWLCLALLLARCAKPLWRWFERQRAQSWPTTQGRIESVGVKAPRGRGPAQAELAYSYTLEGHYYSGFYQREFWSEEEGWEFVRDLQGKAVTVSHNPRNAAKSLLSEDAVSVLLNSRPPAPEGSFQVGVSEVPAWRKLLLWPFIVLSGVGLGLSLWVHLGAVAGRKVVPESLFWMLHLGTLVVWVPALLVGINPAGNTRRKHYWKLMLSETPAWMRYMAYGFLAYAAVNFLISLTQAPQGGSGAENPAIVWRRFSGHWMAFYSVALTTLYAAAVTPKDHS